MNLDERILRVARTCGHEPHLERAVAGFSRLGEHGALWLALGGASWLLDAPARPRWRRALAGVMATYALNTALKLIVRRRRPELEGLPPLTGTPTRLSFPSAHAATSFAAARLYARAGLPRAPLYGLAGALALSRLYLGVHYPSDVLAGALFGTALAEVAVWGQTEAAGGGAVRAEAGGGAVAAGRATVAAT
ncbi:MAG TPA: phosphatase PAP2 family protein [Solirubrobacteraceae bacterium]|nr:phosphatase PAP2 family protein [Solirubrobacteraceae bacterium]